MGGCVNEVKPQSVSDPHNLIEVVDDAGFSDSEDSCAGDRNTNRCPLRKQAKR